MSIFGVVRDGGEGGKGWGGAWGGEISSAPLHHYGKTFSLLCYCVENINREVAVVGVRSCFFAYGNTGNESFEIVSGSGKTGVPKNFDNTYHESVKSIGKLT